MDCHRGRGRTHFQEGGHRLCNQHDKHANCKITVAAQTEQDLECADGRQVNILQSGAEQYTIITSVCGKTDKTSCEADFKEFLTFVASLGK